MADLQLGFTAEHFNGFVKLDSIGMAPNCSKYFLINGLSEQPASSKSNICWSLSQAVTVKDA